MQPGVASMLERGQQVNMPEQELPETENPPRSSMTRFSPDSVQIPTSQRTRSQVRDGRQPKMVASIDHFTATFDRAAVGMVEVDSEGRLLRVNRHLATLLGYEPSDLVGRSIFDPGFAADTARDEAQFRQQVSGQIDGYSIEKRYWRRDGTVFWAEVASSSVRDANG